MCSLTKGLQSKERRLNPKWLNPLGQKNDPKISSHQAQKIEMSSYSRVCWVVSLLFRTNTLFPSNTQTVLGCSKNKRFQRKKHHLPTGKVSIRNREFGDGSFLGLNIINFSYFPGMPWRPLRNIRKQMRERKIYTKPPANVSWPRGKSYS